MPNTHKSSHSVFKKRRVREKRRVGCGDDSAVGSNRRVSSSASSCSQSSSPADSGSKTPLTPEESPPFRSATRKRAAIVAEGEDNDIDNGEDPFARNRHNSGDSDVHVCICQPTPRIPRPRNAFILYRQHHQSSVVAQNPGLANPEISKVIGEQWQKQPTEVKNKWKALAEEEKIRHQLQYPTYRYQPKRSGRRGSLSSECSFERQCLKCGGRSMWTPSTPQHGPISRDSNPASGPQTPDVAITSVSRTVPALQELSVQSPAARQIERQHFANKSIPPPEQDSLKQLSSDPKRRRYDYNHPPTPLQHVTTPRHVAGPSSASFGPNTPFPCAQTPQESYLPNVPDPRQGSLPLTYGMANPLGAMGPPPRPGPGYQQHRLAKAHTPHDHSLTLPPLQLSSARVRTGATATGVTGKTTKEQIMTLDFRYKVEILRKVAPPIPSTPLAPRGPLVAIEGDSYEAVEAITSWLSDTLSKGDDLKVCLREGPAAMADGGKEIVMAQYHALVGDWLKKSNEIRQSLLMTPSSPTDSAMLDAAAEPRLGRTNRIPAVDINDDQRTSCITPEDDGRHVRSEESLGRVDGSDFYVTAVSTVSKTSDTAARPFSSTVSEKSHTKPVTIIGNYSLYASNYFACRIPIDAHDPYAPSDHWQWTATQWRGVVSPDLTVYVRDVSPGDGAKQAVDILDEDNLFVIKRTKAENTGAQEVESSTLRRLGFETSEWIRAFGLKGE